MVSLWADGMLASFCLGPTVLPGSVYLSMCKVTLQLESCKYGILFIRRQRRIVLWVERCLPGHEDRTVSAETRHLCQRLDCPTAEGVVHDRWSTILRPSLMEASSPPMEESMFMCCGSGTIAILTDSSIRALVTLGERLDLTMAGNHRSLNGLI